ncbi:potassium-transporting ATPase subunit KdpC [Deltaproteobacteria bacterium TL4]
MFKTFTQAARLLLTLTLLTGLLYPGIVYLVSQAAFHDQANGSMIAVKQHIVGSKFIGQKFENPKYFWGRPSAVDYNPLPSGGTNQSPSNSALVQAVQERTLKLRQAHQWESQTAIPADLLLASGSGLDPHISPEAASLQVARVAAARNLSAAQTAQLRDLVNQYTEGYQWGFLGAPRVNVLLLNLALDQNDNFL